MRNFGIILKDYSEHIIICHNMEDVLSSWKNKVWAENNSSFPENLRIIQIRDIDILGGWK